MTETEHINLQQFFHSIWQMDGRIGKGAFGRVYRVKNTDKNACYQKAAVKVIPFENTKLQDTSFFLETMTEEERKEKLIKAAGKIVREIEMMNILQTFPNVVKIYDFDIKSDGEHTNVAILMELLTSLKEYMRRKTMDTEDAICLGIDICSALIGCKAREIVHRDIKPDNILVDENGRFKLADFGLSRQITESASNSLKRPIGTDLYMAPEILTYRGKAGYSTDLYSLGLVLYQIVNGGCTPFCTDMSDHDALFASIGMRTAGKPLPKPGTIREDLWEIIRKACAFAVSQRYQEPLQMKRDLQNVLRMIRNQKETEKRRRQMEAELACDRTRAGYTSIVPDMFELANRLYAEGDCNAAIEWYERAGYNGHLQAQCCLGFLYRNGHEIEKNMRKAIEWYEKAAKQGDTAAQFALGEIYEMGEAVEMDYNRAAYYYRMAADGWKNSVAEMAYARCIYQLGRKVQAQGDAVSAVRYYKEAAQKQIPGAQNMLAVCYQNGYGMEADYHQALYWYEQAERNQYPIEKANRGECYFQIGLERGVLGNDKEALAWYEKAKEEGNLEAVKRLAVCYEHGYGTSVNMEKAIAYYQMAYNAGYHELDKAFANCLYQCGRRYYQYAMIDQLQKRKNLEKAEKYFKHAKKLAFTQAYLALGDCRRELGDAEGALACYQEALAHNIDEAYCRIGDYFFDKEKADWEKAAYYYQQAENCGVYDCQEKLAECFYQIGKQIEWKRESQWKTKSAQMYQYAAQKGHAQAKEWLEKKEKSWISKIFK